MSSINRTENSSRKKHAISSKRSFSIFIYLPMGILWFPYLPVVHLNKLKKKRVEKEAFACSFHNLQLASRVEKQSQFNFFFFLISLTMLFERTNEWINIQGFASILLTSHKIRDRRGKGTGNKIQRTILHLVPFVNKYGERFSLIWKFSLKFYILSLSFRVCHIIQ